jgi:hypothetical protein
MGGHRFSLATNAERVCAEVMLKSKRYSGMTIRRKVITLQGDYLAYRDLISRQRAARSPVKASRCSSVGQALPR